VADVKVVDYRGKSVGLARKEAAKDAKRLARGGWHTVNESWEVGRGGCLTMFLTAGIKGGGEVGTLHVTYKRD
jgi:hypothetical protein